MPIVARRALLGLGVLVVLLLAVRLVVGGAAPATQGLADDAAGGCPPSPNCVSTLATTAAAAVDPLRCDADEDVVLAVVDEALPRAEQVGPGHWVVRSLVVGFPDDVHVAVAGDGRVDVLSASRVGQDDLGVNRARVERLREALAADPRC